MRSVELGMDQDDLASRPGLALDLMFSLVPRRFLLVHAAGRVLCDDWEEKTHTLRHQTRQFLDVFNGFQGDDADPDEEAEPTARLHAGRNLIESLARLESTTCGLLRAKYRQLGRDRRAGRAV